jgi:DNA mismatch repair ATPase MutS
MWFSKRTEELFRSTELIDDELSKVRILFEHIENISLSGRNEVRKFLSPIFKNEQKPSLLLKRLEKLSEMIAVRGNPFIKIILNVLMPWDVYLSIRLLKCRDEIKNNLPDWLNILYELEALNSLANFAYLNPDFTFPEILQGDNSKYVFVSNNLGHPLIPESEKITNNFSLQKEKEIVIITGSNMSGKSTFIKTIGVNLCLAYAGAPVNADKLTVSLFRLFTCIKVTDSVTDGISYFYAEVKRLKKLLDEAKVECSKPLFFLIDEIFSGTNNKERSIGSRAYIKALAELEVCGAVATHDLNLINSEKDIKCVSNFHFREDISNGKMVFDYKLHPGPCPTTNAIRVMQLAGLPVSSEQ